MFQISNFIIFYLFLSTQRISSEKSDPILSRQRTFKRDDVTENGDFTIRKQRLQGTKFGFRWCEIHVLRVRFLCGNPRLVAFQIGNETFCFR